MAEKKTLARPYAKAAYEHAKQQNKVVEWLAFLKHMSGFVSTPEFSLALNNPKIKKDQLLQLLADIYSGNLTADQQNFLATLQHYNRIKVLPEIAVLFETQVLQDEKQMQVKVRSAFPVSDKLHDKLAQALKIRLQCEVSLDVEIDKSLLGGLIISTGDLVIDSSVKGQLTRMRELLSE